MMRAGLVIATVACLYVSVASVVVGYPVEVALLRGIVGFAAVCAIAYVAELVVATAPPRRRPVPEAPAAPAPQTNEPTPDQPG